MLGAFRIARVAGIPIRVHVLFVLLVGALALAPSTGLLEFVALGVLVVCVVLHELGHALVAQRFGIRVVDITLWPLGGLARLSHIPESSRVEACIAIAGPGVNIVLALIAAPFLVFGLVSSPEDSVLALIPFAFVVVNSFMAAFNLLPAFPTDGGRLVRAWFARKHSWYEATARAVWIGRVVAVGIAAVGIAWGNWMVPIIALWLFWMGGVELAQVRARHVRVPHAYDELRVPHAHDVAAPSRGFSDEDVQRIESFRGPLATLRAASEAPKTETREI